MQLYLFETKLPNLELKTRPKQLIGSLPLYIALHKCIVHDAQAFLHEPIKLPFCLPWDGFQLSNNDIKYYLNRAA